MSRVCWHMRLKLGQWRQGIDMVWKTKSTWWWDGCVECLCRIEGSVRICSSLGIQNVIEAGELRWLEHLECKSGDEWVSAFRKTEVAGSKCWCRGMKAWGESVTKDIKLLGLQSEWTIFKNVWRDLIWEKYMFLNKMVIIVLNCSLQTHPAQEMLLKINSQVQGRRGPCNNRCKGEFLFIKHLWGFVLYSCSDTILYNRCNVQLLYNNY